MLDGLTLGASYTWLDPQYQDFEDDTTVLPRAAAAGCPLVVYKGGLGTDPSDLSDPANGSPTCRIDQSGKFSVMTLLRAMDPKYSLDAEILRTFYECTKQKIVDGRKPGDSLLLRLKRPDGSTAYIAVQLPKE